MAQGPTQRMSLQTPRHFLRVLLGSWDWRGLERKSSGQAVCLDPAPGHPESQESRGVREFQPHEYERLKNSKPVGARRFVPSALETGENCVSATRARLLLWQR